MQLLSEWITLSSYGHFLAPKHTQSICCSLSAHHFPPDVCLQTEKQHEIIQSGATESVHLSESLAERLKRERLYLLRDLHLCVKPSELDVPADKHQFD